MRETRLHLRLLGMPILAGGRDAEPAALERKDAALLAVLALQGPTARDTLAEWLWPDVPLKTANLSLRQRIFRLRRKTGHELLQTGQTLALAEGVSADVHSNESAAGELLAGMLYADCPALAEWLRQQRERRAAALHDTRARTAAAHEAAGELAAAIDVAMSLQAEDALSDHAVRRLMRLHYLRGDRTAAVAAFERFEQHLKSELGARPDPETVALLRTVESGAAVPAPALQRTPVPASLLRPPRLVGRNAELAALADAWAARRVPLLLGEAGMGKTRLLAEFAHSHPDTLLVQARPGDAGVPFALLARWLRAVQQRIQLPPQGPHARELARVLPEWSGGTLVSGEGQRLLLQSAVEWLLHQAAERNVTRTLLDDLHFADEASLELLQSLLCSERLSTQQWCLAMRPADGPPAAAALQSALQEDQRLHTVELRPLGLQAVKDLLTSLALPGLDAAELAAPLLRHTGGNPLFMLETLKDMVMADAGSGTATRLPQPTTVGALIERRLRTLSPGALSLARVAAIAGVDFGIELAAQVLCKSPLDLADAWAELEQAQVLAGGVFAHDLVFDAVLRSVPDAIAQHVHGGVAQVLQAQASEPARVAEHWHRAARWSVAAQCFEQASTKARRAGLLGEARSLWERAVEDHGQADDLPAQRRCEINGIELVLITAGAAAALALAERLLDCRVPDAERVDLLSASALVQLYAGRCPQALAHGEEAIALAAALGEPARAIDAQRVCGQAQAQMGQVAAGVARLRSVLGLLQAPGTDRQRYETTAALAYALNQGHQLTEAAQALTETIRLAAQAGDLAEVMISRRNLAAIELVRGYADSALEQAQAADLLAGHAAAALGPHEAMNTLAKGAASQLAGQYGVALELLQAAQQALQGVGAWQAAVATNQLASLWLQLGQWHRAAPLLCGDISPGDNQNLVASRRLTLQARLARCRAAAEPAALAEQLTQGLRRFEGHTDERQLAALRLELSRSAPLETSLLAVRAVRDYAKALELQGLVLQATLREADLLLAVDPGHADVLAAQLRARPAGLYPMDGYLPEVWLVCARVALAHSRADEARPLLHQAARWIAQASATLPPALRRTFEEQVSVNTQVRQLLQRLPDAA